jgi:hypothetical protein
VLTLIAILLSSHGFPFRVINLSSMYYLSQLSISCTVIPYIIFSYSYIFCTRSNTLNWMALYEFLRLFETGGVSHLNPTRTRDYWLKVATLFCFSGPQQLGPGSAMLSSHPVQLTDVPYLMTKTPGRALANRGENLGVLQAKAKNTNGAPRTPFQPASARESFPPVG